MAYWYVMCQDEVLIAFIDHSIPVGPRAGRVQDTVRPACSLQLLVQFHFCISVSDFQSWVPATPVHILSFFESHGLITIVLNKPYVASLQSLNLLNSTEQYYNVWIGTRIVNVPNRDRKPRVGNTTTR